MESFYNLLPSLLAFLSGAAFSGILVYEKSSELGLIRWIAWLLGSLLFFALLGLITSRIESLVARFVCLVAASLLFGAVYLILTPKTLAWWRRENISDVMIAALALYFTGITGYILVYSFMQHESPFQYVLLTGSLGFLVPTLALKSYDFWLAIPPLRYRTWHYPLHEPVPRLLPVDTVKVIMNFTPVPGKNAAFEGYEVEYPGNVALGQLFHYFISFHNKHREYRKMPIQYVTDNHMPLEWTLFKYSPQRKKIYLDTEKTLIENNIRGNEAIYATSTNQLIS